MNDSDYLEIILKGLLGNTGDYYANHIYREWKKAENNHYSLEEFFSGLIRQHKGLKEEIDRQYYKGLNEFYIIQGIYESEGKDIKQLEGQEPKKDHYSINLFLLTTDPRYSGLTLRQSNLIYIGGQIAKAFEKAEKEKSEIDEPTPKKVKKIRYHQDFIKRAIEILFTEQIERSRETEGDNFLPTVEGIKVEFIDTPIDTRNPEKLNEIATKRLSEFINEHDDNTKEMFIENEIEIAKEYQTYFPKYKIDREEKEYYFKLQRWIECLNKLNEQSESNGTGNDRNDKKPSKLTLILKLYYEKGCKPLTKPQVQKLATEKNITKSVLVNRWNDLKADSYQHNGNVNNVKEFIKSYKTLMQIFKEIDNKAFQAVENHYNQLNETYPDLAY